MERSQLLSAMFDDKTIKVLQTLLLKKERFYLRDLSRDTGVSLATTYRIVQKLTNIGLVSKESDEKFTFYKIVRGTPIFEEMHEVVFGPREEPLEVLKKGLDKQFKGFYELVVLGQQPLKVLVVSSSVDTHYVKQIIADLEMKSGSVVEYTVVTPEIYQSMQKMGALR